MTAVCLIADIDRQVTALQTEIAVAAGGSRVTAAIFARAKGLTALTANIGDDACLGNVDAGAIAAHATAAVVAEIAAESTALLSGRAAMAGWLAGFVRTALLVGATAGVATLPIGSAALPLGLAGTVGAAFLTFGTAAILADLGIRAAGQIGISRTRLTLRATR